MDDGKCTLCEYEPVPVVYITVVGVKSVSEEEEVAVCAVCRDGGLVEMHKAPIHVSTAVALGKLANVLIDAEGPARREVAESLLRGDGYPSGDYEAL